MDFWMITPHHDTLRWVPEHGWSNGTEMPSPVTSRVSCPSGPSSFFQPYWASMCFPLGVKTTEQNWADSTWTSCFGRWSLFDFWIEWQIAWQMHLLDFDRMRPRFHPISILHHRIFLRIRMNQTIRITLGIWTSAIPRPFLWVLCRPSYQSGRYAEGWRCAIAMWHGLNHKITSLVVPKGFGCWVYQSAKLGVPLYPTVGFWCEFPCIDALILSNHALASTTWDMLLDF